MKLHFMDYRYAGAVLEDPTFKASKQEIITIFQHAPIPLLDPTKDPKQGGVKRRSRKATKANPGKPRYFFLPVDQKELNKHLDGEFKKGNWEWHPLVVKKLPGGINTGLRSDFKKGKLQIEVQFGNMARWYTDVFKFQLSYSQGEIDVAVLVVPMQRFANLIDENVAYFERVERELPHAKMSLTLPIWVIGIEPDDYTPLKNAYDQAFTNLETATGKQIAKIPYDIRITEEAPPADDEQLELDGDDREFEGIE